MKKAVPKKVVPFTQDSQFFFKVGIRYADKKGYTSALKYLSKAAEMEPYNPDYLFNLAGVLAELREVEKSNEILLGILKNIDPTMTECYFGIGCNYFDLENFNKSREYFEKYVYFEPEGPFADEVYDVLYYLQIYEDVGSSPKKNKLLMKLANEGKKLLVKGDYEKACEKLEKAIEIDPEVTSPRNDISLAYFLTGDREKAVSLAKSVLKLDPGDVYANCNLALFYADTGRGDLLRNQLKLLPKLEIGDGDEVLKLLDTYVRLGEYSKIKGILSKCLEEPANARIVLKESLNDNNLPEEARAAISQALNMQNSKTVHKKVNDEAENKRRGTVSKPVRWKKEWESIIDCAMQKKEFNYKESYKQELKDIWLRIISSTYTEELPVIRKAEVWAAALEYIYCKDHFINVTKKKLADKYKVSESALISKIKDFIK